MAQAQPQPQQVNNEERPQNQRLNVRQDDDDDDDWMDEIYDYIARLVVEWNISEEELYQILSVINTEDNDAVLARGPLSQPVVMRCLASHLDIGSLKNLRLACKSMKTMIDPYFYKRGTFVIKNSAAFYRFVKLPNTENHLILPKIKRIEFYDDMDLFEVSRIMYRSRWNLEELSIVTTPQQLRGEFQNIAAVLLVMEKLHTLRLHLPRRYLLHQLFRSQPLNTIKTIQFNFENAHPITVCGVFDSCQALEYIEMTNQQVQYIKKLAVAPIELTHCRVVKKSDLELQVYKITKKEGNKC